MIPPHGIMVTHPGRFSISEQIVFSVIGPVFFLDQWKVTVDFKEKFEGGYFQIGVDRGGQQAGCENADPEDIHQHNHYCRNNNDKQDFDEQAGEKKRSRRPIVSGDLGKAGETARIYP